MIALLLLLSFIVNPLTITPENASGLQEMSRLEFGTHYANVLAFHPNRDFMLFSGHADGTLAHHDLTFSISDEWAAHDGSVTGLAVIPDGTQLVSAGQDGCVYVWQIETRQMLRELTGCSRGPITALALNEAGTWLAVGYQSGLTQLYDFQSGDKQASFFHKGDVVSLDFSSDYPLSQAVNTEWLAVADVGSVWIYELVDPAQEHIRLLAFFNVTYFEAIADIQIQPGSGTLTDGIMVVSQSPPQMWTTVGPMPRADIWSQSELVYPQKVDFNQGGTLVAVAGCDVLRCVIEIFNAEMGLAEEQSIPWGERLLVLEGHSDQHTDIAFSPQNVLLASASRDGVVILWGVPDDTS
ncbi:MAG: hypothetical protein OHK0046_09820 [Anaerolineae bacterium]